MNALLSLLANLEADGLTGRVNVGGDPGGWVYIQEGLVYCAERADEPRMLLAMAEEGLFTAEEWQMALRLPSAHKWRALVGDDDGRLNELAMFARTFVEHSLRSLASSAQSCVFAPSIAHPFGALARWSPGDLVAEGDVTTVDATGPDQLQELLEEISPNVRAVRRRLVV
jgi:hypothetical protein